MLSRRRSSGPAPRIHPLGGGRLAQGVRHVTSIEHGDGEQDAMAYQRYRCAVISYRPDDERMAA